MEELLAGCDLERLKEGAIVAGLVTEIRQNEVVIDVGGKSEGTIPNVEFVDVGDLEIGGEIEVFLERLEGSPIRRIGFDCWLRNLAVALGNANADVTIIEALGLLIPTSTTVVETKHWILPLFTLLIRSFLSSFFNLPCKKPKL